VDQEYDEDALCERKEPWAAPSWLNRGEAMSTWPILAVLVVVGIGLVSPALGDEWKDEFWDGPCRVKREAKGGEFKKEITCKDGVGARWHGEWKKEFWDGPCRVKVEATHDEYKEEVKCDRHR
jgi:hypothetical protein